MEYWNPPLLQETQKLLFGDGQQAVSLDAFKHSLLLAGRPRDFDFGYRVGFAQAKVQRIAALRQIAGLSIVDLGIHA